LCSFDLGFQISENRDKADSLRREVDDLNAQLAITAPKAKLLAAQEGERTTKGVVDEQAKEIQRLQKLASNTGAELEQFQRAFDDYKLKNDDKVPRVEHLTVQSQLRDQTDAIAALEHQIAALQANKSELKQMLAGLQEEVEAWNEKAGEMVDRKEMMAVKSEVHSKALTLAEVRAQLDEALADVKRSREQLYSGKLELSAAKEALETMVSRSEHVAVVGECKKTAEQLSRAREEQSQTETALAKAKEEVSELKSKIQDLSGEVLQLPRERAPAGVASAVEVGGLD